jgi:hypothetical protein
LKYKKKDKKHQSLNNSTATATSSTTAVVAGNKQQSKNDSSNVMGKHSKAIEAVQDETVCSICGGAQDEDLIVLCDGEGCSNEVHLYCLTPVLTEIPEGDWYCDECNVEGSTKQLKADIESYLHSVKPIYPSSGSDYEFYLICLQQRLIPLDSWQPHAQFIFTVSEFDSSSIDLIGCIVRISFNSLDYHAGRIVSRRYDSHLDRWEHLLQFKR